MIEFEHLFIELMAIAISFALAYYCIRLFTKFFKGGVFATGFKAFSVASSMLGISYLSDVILDLAAIKSPEFGIIHHILTLMFLGFLFYGINDLYRAWSKIGNRDLQ